MVASSLCPLVPGLAPWGLPWACPTLGVLETEGRAQKHQACGGVQVGPGRGSHSWASSGIRSVAGILAAAGISKAVLGPTALHHLLGAQHTEPGTSQPEGILQWVLR